MLHSRYKVDPGARTYLHSSFHRQRKICLSFPASKIIHITGMHQFAAGLHVNLSCNLFISVKYSQIPLKQVCVS